MRSKNSQDQIVKMYVLNFEEHLHQQVEKYVLNEDIMEEEVKIDYSFDYDHEDSQ